MAAASATLRDRAPACRGMRSLRSAAAWTSSGTPMPSYKGTATDAEMWDLANYVGSLRRKPVWEMTADEVTAFYRQQEAEHLANDGIDIRAEGTAAYETYRRVNDLEERAQHDLAARGSVAMAVAVLRELLGHPCPPPPPPGGGAPRRM